MLLYIKYSGHVIAQSRIHQLIEFSSETFEKQNYFVMASPKLQLLHNVVAPIGTLSTEILDIDVSLGKEMFLKPRLNK